MAGRVSCSKTWSEGWGSRRSEAGGSVLLPAFLGVSRGVLDSRPTPAQAPSLEKGLQHP